MVATSLPFWMQGTGRSMKPFWAERQVAEAPPARPRAALGPVTGAVVVEPCPSNGIETHVEAWADLADRALEPNAFMEPGFALAAILHLPAGDRPDALLCWERQAGGGSALIGVLLFRAGRATLSPGHAVAWCHPLWVTGAPLLDRTRAAVALDAMLGWLRSRQRLRGGLLLKGIEQGGALHRLVAAGNRHRHAVLDERTRAVVDHADRLAGSGPSARRAKEMRRQGRRLGAGALRSATTLDEVAAATERFLALEARGWKGRRGTALLCSSHAATFTRTMTRLMALRGLCRIDELAVDGEPAAMGIVLRSGDRTFFWKTAYDEAAARHSPGKLLAGAIALRDGQDPTVSITDSCAVPDHPMVDRIWAGRITVVDALVAGPGDSDGDFRSTARGLRLHQAARRYAKALYRRLRRR